MSKSDALSLMRCIEQLRRSLDAEILPGVEQLFARMNGVPPAQFAGQGRKLINEAQVRRYVIDPVLAALGWELSSSASALVEAGVEPVDQNGHRRFLDYFGFASTGEARALLLVEAKRLTVSLPTHDAGMELRQVIVDALRVAFGAAGSLSEEWRDILTTLADYVARLNRSEYGSPRRVLLTNGEWFVVFLNPARTLLDRVIAAADLIVARSFDEAVAMAQDLFSCLSFESLAEELPVQNSADLRLFVQGDAGPLKAALAVEVATGDVGGLRPVMGFRPSVLVETPNGAWVRFHNAASEYRVLGDEAELDQKMADLGTLADSLLGELREQRELTLLSATAFEHTHPRIPRFPSTTLLTREAPNRFVLHLGDRPAPFVPMGTYEGCPYHAFGPAYTEGKAAGQQPILRRSTNPAAYFPSGSVYHCAHRTVHNLRATRCVIRTLDEFLCCRGCALQERCWPEGFTGFPCVAQDLEQLKVTGETNSSR